MKKVINLGKIAYYGSRKINECTVEFDLKFKDNVKDFSTLEVVNNVPIFTASGNIWNASHTDIVSGGQNLDELAKLFPHNLKFQRIVEVWREYHLNDLQAGTKIQQEALKDCPDWDYTVRCAYLANVDLLTDTVTNPENEYRYGTEWLYRPIPAQIIEEIQTW